MRRMFCLILAAMLMLSHGSMGAAAPHWHVGLMDDHHVSADHDLVHDHDEHADAHDAASGDVHGSDADETDEGNGGVQAHIHLVAGLARMPAMGNHPIITMPVAPAPAVTRLLVSREVAPLLEPPTA